LLFLTENITTAEIFTDIACPRAVKTNFQQTTTNVGQSIRLLCCTLGLAGWVAKGKDYRSLVVTSHDLDEFLSECASYRSCTNGHGRLENFANFLQAANVSMLFSVHCFLWSYSTGFTILKKLENTSYAFK
jgi:hypothetical protein